MFFVNSGNDRSWDTPTTGAEPTTPFGYVGQPFYDKFIQRWVTITCVPVTLLGLYNTNHQKSFEGGNYLFYTLSCVLVNSTEYLKPRDPVISGLFDVNNNLPMLQVNSKMFLISADSAGKVLMSNVSIPLSFNMTSLFSPAVSRYTGFFTKDMIDWYGMQDKKADNTSKRKNTTLSRDATNPNLLLANEVHLHTRTLGMQKLGANNHYVVKNLFFFEADLLASEQNNVNTLISGAQTQVTLLSLIIIIMICAVVMCISFM